MFHDPSNPPFRHPNSAVRATIALAARDGKGAETALACRCHIDAATIENLLHRLEDATRRWRFRSGSGWWL